MNFLLDKQLERDLKVEFDRRRSELNMKASISRLSRSNLISEKGSVSGPKGFVLREFPRMDLLRS